MDPFLSAIRQNPLTFLPEVSLNAFWHFRSGYAYRCAVEGRPHDWQFDGHAFWKWLAKRFELQAGRALNDIAIVGSFSPNEREAFYKYFELLEEFLAEADPAIPSGAGKPERMGFIAMVKAIRERPPLYLGYASFRALHAYLRGDERAYRDLHLPEDEGRAVFTGFTNWVETEKNRALPRPWHKVIEFWSGGIDCGHDSKSGAFSLFFFWLDKYAESLTKPGLFSVEGLGNVGNRAFGADD